ncbi:Heme d1 biosynthesis protein NirL [hydrothermal vent metagenome]|uniref:siroheme decarboxylase n=1 Tax=hydrothermal vent metagenome TaxID=652676 RepID=A0A3B1BDJ9_9ZZZZ
MKRLSPVVQPPLGELDERDRKVIVGIQRGLPLMSHPYAEIGKTIGMPESEVIECVRSLLERGLIKRMGVIVRHRELGYRANAMVVWDIPDEHISALGKCIGRFEFITLCYRRPRRLPDWPYNLFSMIHGRNREQVMDKLAFLIERCSLQDIPHEVLFSHRRFKQCGAVYQTPLNGISGVSSS